MSWWGSVRFINWETQSGLNCKFGVSSLHILFVPLHHLLFITLVHSACSNIPTKMYTLVWSCFRTPPLCTCQIQLKFLICVLVPACLLLPLSLLYGVSHAAGDLLQDNGLTGHIPLYLCFLTKHQVIKWSLVTWLPHVLLHHVPLGQAGSWAVQTRILQAVRAAWEILKMKELFK